MIRVTPECVESVKKICIKYPVPKYLLFCEYFVNKGLEVYLKESKSTYSKYVYLSGKGISVKVRFSDHIPSRKRMDSDFYVGGLYNSAHDVAKEINKLLFSNNISKKL